MENQNVVIPGTAETLNAVINARRGLVKGAKGTGEVIKGYARALCAAFNVVGIDGKVRTPWYELKGKERAGIKAERDAFASEMTEAGLEKSVHVYWQRVKEASGYVTSGNRVKGNETTDQKTAADLKTLINRIFKAEENGEDCKASDHKKALITVYEALGGDVDSLG